MLKASDNQNQVRFTSHYTRPVKPILTLIRDYVQNWQNDDLMLDFVTFESKYTTIALSHSNSFADTVSLGLVGPEACGD